MDSTLFDRSEILRYMGVKGDPDEATLAAVEKCIAVFEGFDEPRVIYRYEDIVPSDSGVTLASGLHLAGEDIRSHLADCTFCGILAATVGAQADNFIRRAQVTDMVLALAADACATCAVESACDRAERQMVSENSGYHTTFRYSPGYGDLPIETQPRLLAAVDAPRRIGLTCTSSCLLTPTKSVTAVIGFSKTPVPSHRRGCAVCSLRETCSFRKKGESCGS